MLLDIHLTPKRESENSRQYAYRILFENIMTLRLKPGTVINENELTQLLSTSRTPIREAIFRLKDRYLVEVYPQKASVVSKIDLNLLKEGYFLRCAIEPMVFDILCDSVDASTVAELDKNLQAQKAVVEGSMNVHEFFDLDNDFHKIVYRGAKKRHVWTAIQSVSGHFNRIRYFDAICADLNIELFYEEHKTMYYSIISGASENIRNMYPGHLSFYQKNLPRLMERYADYFVL